MKMLSSNVIRDIIKTTFLNRIATHGNTSMNDLLFGPIKEGVLIIGPVRNNIYCEVYLNYEIDTI